MIGRILSRLFILFFGTLFPAYASYKTIRNKDAQLYIRWTMYWIVFALYSFIEAFTDTWLMSSPFYYEVKIIILIWLLLPANKGSTLVYRHVLHPLLVGKERAIDAYIDKAKIGIFIIMTQLASKAINGMKDIIMQNALSILALATVNNIQPQNPAVEVELEQIHMDPQIFQSEVELYGLVDAQNGVAQREQPIEYRDESIESDERQCSEQDRPCDRQCSLHTEGGCGDLCVDSHYDGRRVMQCQVLHGRSSNEYGDGLPMQFGTYSQNEDDVD